MFFKVFQLSNAHGFLQTLGDARVVANADGAAVMLLEVSRVSLDDTTIIGRFVVLTSAVGGETACGVIAHNEVKLSDDNEAGEQLITL